MMAFITSIALKKREIIGKFNFTRTTVAKRTGNNKVGTEWNFHKVAESRVSTT